MLVDAAILAGAVTMPRHRGCDKRRLLRGQCRHAGRQKTDRATPKDIASTCVEPACRFDASQDKGKKCCLWLCRDQPDVRDGHHSDFANFCYIADFFVIWRTSARSCSYIQCRLHHGVFITSMDNKRLYGSEMVQHFCWYHFADFPCDLPVSNVRGICHPDGCRGSYTLAIRKYDAAYVKWHR